MAYCQLNNTQKTQLFIFFFSLEYIFSVSKWNFKKKSSEKEAGKPTAPDISYSQVKNVSARLKTLLAKQVISQAVN